MVKFKGRDLLSMEWVPAQAAAWRRDGIEAQRPTVPYFSNFLACWVARGRIVCNCSTRGHLRTTTRRSFIIRQRYGRPGAFVSYRLNEDPWVAYDTSGSDHKGAKNSTCPRLHRRHSYLAPYKINAHCVGNGRRR